MCYEVTALSLWTFFFVFKFASMENEFFSVFDVFFIFDICKKKNKPFPYSRTQIQFFFYKPKPESTLHMRVKFYFSRLCRTQKNFQLFIKLLLKIFFLQFFVFFDSLKIRDIFLPCKNVHSIITNRILFMLY